ncbi:MAG: amidohydrolase family protein [Deltaproteobacteria bacterium]|nr:amidohydrolase family protein [Deltaproteobacteria bacterium]
MKPIHEGDSPGPKTSSEGNPGLLHSPLPAVNDVEGEAVPENLPPVVDAHVHLFPDQIFSAIYQWFDRYGWPIRYRLKATEVVEFLLSRGIHHIIALHYAHKPGVARQLNMHMAALCNQFPEVTGLATVFPGEPAGEKILEEAFELGLYGVKLHCHVQCFEMECEGMHDIYRICADHKKPLVMHVGREPKSPAYACDPYELCDATRVERVLKAYPGLNVCVPHLGADEFTEYQRLLERYDTLWLDTTMTLAEYLPFEGELPLLKMRPDRVMYGTDFPSIPYAWDRELKKLCSLRLSEKTMAQILGENAARFFGLDWE